MAEGPWRQHPDLLRWLDHLRHEKGASPRTVEAYLRDLQQFAAACPDFAAARWPAVSEADVRRVLGQRFRQGIQPASLRRWLSAIRNFYRWLDRQGQVRRNPADGIRAPKAARTLPEVMEVDVIGHLIQSLPADERGQRDRLIIELFYGCGLRLSELAGLRRGQLDFENGEIRVTGKGNKTRVVPFGGQAARAARQWLARHPGQAEDWLFPGRNGHLHVNTIQKMLKRRAQQAGIWQHLHPHMLRHSYATHLLQSSGNLRAVQLLLGHASISTTQVYTHLDFQHLMRVYEKTHPRARQKD